MPVTTTSLYYIENFLVKYEFINRQIIQGRETRWTEEDGQEWFVFFVGDVPFYMDPYEDGIYAYVLAYIDENGVSHWTKMIYDAEGDGASHWTKMSYDA